MKSFENAPLVRKEGRLLKPLSECLKSSFP